MFDDPVVPQASRLSSSEGDGFPVIPRRYADKGTLLPSLQNGGGNHDVSGESRDESGKWTADPNKPKLDKFIADQIPDAVDHLVDKGKSTDDIKDLLQKSFKNYDADLIAGAVDDHLKTKEPDEAVLPTVVEDSPVPEKHQELIKKLYDTQIGNGVDPAKAKQKLIDKAQKAKGYGSDDVEKILNEYIKNTDHESVKDTLATLTKDHPQATENFLKTILKKKHPDASEDLIDTAVKKEKGGEVEGPDFSTLDEAPVAPETPKPFSEKDQEYMVNHLNVLKDQGLTKEWAKANTKAFFPNLKDQEFSELVDKYWDKTVPQAEEPAAPVVPDDKSKPYYIKKTDKSEINKDIEAHLANGLSHDEVKEKIKEKWGSSYQEKSLLNHVDGHETVKSQKDQTKSAVKFAKEDLNDFTDYVDELTQKHHTDKWLVKKLNGKFGHKYPEALLEKGLQATKELNNGGAAEFPDGLIEGDKNDSDDVVSEPEKKVAEPDEEFFDYTKEKTPEPVDEATKTDYNPWQPIAQGVEEGKQEENDKPSDGEVKSYLEAVAGPGKSYEDKIGALMEMGLTEAEAQQAYSDYLDSIGKDSSDPDQAVKADEPDSDAEANSVLKNYTPDPAEESPAEESEKPTEVTPGDAKTYTEDAQINSHYAPQDVKFVIDKLKSQGKSWSEVMNFLNDDYSMSDNEAAEHIQAYKQLYNKPGDQKIDENLSILPGLPPKAVQGWITDKKQQGLSDDEIVAKMKESFSTSGGDDSLYQKQMDAHNALYGGAGNGNPFSAPTDVKSYKDLGAGAHSYGLKDYFTDSEGLVTQEQWQKVMDAASDPSGFDESVLWTPDGAPKSIEDVLSGIDNKSGYSYNGPDQLLKDFPQLKSPYLADELDSYLKKKTITDKNKIGEIADYVGANGSNHWNLFDDDNQNAKEPEDFLPPPKDYTPKGITQWADNQAVNMADAGHLQDYVNALGSPTLSQAQVDKLSTFADHMGGEKLFDDYGSPKPLEDVLAVEIAGTSNDLSQALNQSTKDISKMPDGELYDAVGDWADGEKSQDVLDALMAPYGEGAKKAKELAAKLGTDVNGLATVFHSSKDTSDVAKVLLKDCGVPKDDLIAAMKKYWFIQKDTATNIINKINDDGPTITPSVAGKTGWNVDNADPSGQPQLQSVLDYIKSNPDASKEKILNAVLKNESSGALEGIGIWDVPLKKKSVFLNGLGIKPDDIFETAKEAHAGAVESSVKSAYAIDDLDPDVSGGPSESGWNTDGDSLPGFEDAQEWVKNHPDVSEKDLIQKVLYTDKELGIKLSSPKKKAKFLNAMGVSTEAIKNAIVEKHGDNFSESQLVSAYGLSGLTDKPKTGTPATGGINAGDPDSAIEPDKLESIGTWAKSNKIGRANLTQLIVSPQDNTHLAQFTNANSGESMVDLTKKINAMPDKDKAKWLIDHNVQNDTVFNAFYKKYPKVKPSVLAKQLGIVKPYNVEDPAAQLSFSGQKAEPVDDMESGNSGLDALYWWQNNGKTLTKDKIAELTLAPYKSGGGGVHPDITSLGNMHPTYYGYDIASSINEASAKDKAQFLFNQGLTPAQIKEAWAEYGKGTQFNSTIPPDSFLNSLKKMKTTGGLEHDSFDKLTSEMPKSFDHAALAHAILDPNHDLGADALNKIDGEAKPDYFDEAMNEAKNLTVGQKVKSMIEKGGMSAKTVWDAAVDMYPHAPDRALETILDIPKPEGGKDGFKPEPKVEEPVIPGEDLDQKVLNNVFEKYQDKSKEKVINTFVKPFGVGNYTDMGEKENLEAMLGENGPYDLDKIDGKKKIKFLKDKGYSDEEIYSTLKKKTYPNVPDDHLEKAFGVTRPASMEKKQDETVYSNIPAFAAIQKHQLKNSDKLDKDDLLDLVLNPGNYNDNLQTVAGSPHNGYGNYDLAQQLKDATHKEQYDFLKNTMGYKDDEIWKKIVDRYPKVNKGVLAKSFGMKPKGVDLSPPPKPKFDTHFIPESEKPPKIEPYGPKEKIFSTTYGEDTDARKLFKHINNYAYENSASIDDLMNLAFNPKSPDNDELLDKIIDYSKKKGADDDYYSPALPLGGMTRDEIKEKIAATKPEALRAALNAGYQYFPYSKMVKKIQDVHPGMTGDYASKALGIGGYEQFVPEKDDEGNPKTLNVWAKNFSEKSPADQKKFVDFVLNPNSALSQKDDHPVHQLDLEQTEAGGAPENQKLSDLYKTIKTMAPDEKAQYLLNKGFDNNAVYTAFKKQYKGYSAADIEGMIPVVAPKKHKDHVEPPKNGGASPLTQYHPQKPSDDYYGGSSNWNQIQKEFTKPVEPDYHSIVPVETEEEKKLPHRGSEACSHFRSHWANNKLTKPSSYESQVHSSYMGSGYGALNKDLRQNGSDGCSSQHKKEMNAIDRMITSYTTPNAFHVMRGSGNNSGAVPHEDQTGKTITLGGYNSTSFSPETARGFMKGQKQLFLDIYVPKGFHCIPGTPSEQELILPRNTQFYVQQDKQIGNAKCMKLVAIPPKVSDLGKHAMRKRALTTLMIWMSE